ncbi:MAG: aminotransferase class V-fold PLP-dependent enzyme [Planctomycetes bacterium]|nr:aminotransferase class V-fold PLP-dependent enzyme [Planctomycetota bacterium]
MASIVGLGVAAKRVIAEAGNHEHIKAMRDRLHDGLTQPLGQDAVLLGHPERRLPNTLAIGFRGRLGGEVLAGCPDICASTGAACHSGRRERSAVLEAMNVPEEIAFGAVRFSLGRFTTEAEIDQAVLMLVNAIAGSLKT